MATLPVIKHGLEEEAKAMFGNTDVNITSNGRPQLGAAVGSEEFTREYVKSEVNEWSSTISLLSEIAQSQPHAAYAALTHGLLNKWSYLSCVSPMLEKSFLLWTTP